MNRSEINDYIRNNQHLSQRQLAKECGISLNAVQLREYRMGITRSSTTSATQGGKEGVESRNDDKVIINWTTKTIITDLGEFGNFLCNFTTHGAIQRAYVHSYEGKGETAAEVATRFNFVHAKAVHMYARLHGFTKASLGQTDLEFELGLTPEEAAEENIQSLKRRALKLTEKRKWEEVQRDADKWNNFRHNVFYPMSDWVEEHLPKYKAPKLRVPKKSPGAFAGVVGVSDWHYLKYCFDHKGRTTYNKSIARKALEDANTTLIREMMRVGTPEMLFVPTGTDNLHFDTLTQTTTRGTPQAGQSVGDWQIELDQYVDIVIGMIDLYAQLAPVTVVSMPGNHDKHTSIMLRVLLSKYYERHKHVTVIDCAHPRTYLKYGRNAFMFTHGDDIPGPKLRNNAHKFFMAEAETQGVSLSGSKHFSMFTGHIHTDQYADLGVVKHFIIPSLSGEDRWHRESGYVGSAKESSLYLFDKNNGRRQIIYS